MTSTCMYTTLFTLLDQLFWELYSDIDMALHPVYYRDSVVQIVEVKLWGREDQQSYIIMHIAPLSVYVHNQTLGD